MSQCLVPNWNNLRHQRQEHEDEEEEATPEAKIKRSSTHINKILPNPPRLMPSQRVSELKWENGHLINTHGVIDHQPQTSFLDHQMPSIILWPGADIDTLESVVHQASHYKRHIDSNSDLGLDSLDYYNTAYNEQQLSENINVMDSVVASSDHGGGKWPTNSTSCKGPSVALVPTHKRSRQNRSPAKARPYDGGHGQPAKSSATASFESRRSLRTKTTDDDSACQENPDDEVDDKTETVRSHSTRRSRAAAVHNQSERRRRDRINQKMKTLQKLVPNASKTDKASVLDEVIEYMKQLQVQLQMMSSRTMSQMFMPAMGMQHLQMPNIMARMGMGMGMGMLDHSMAAAPPMPPILHPTGAPGSSTFVHPPFMLPNLIPTLPQSQSKSVNHRHPMPLSDSYSAYLAQTMNNMELYSKMAAFYRQQADDQMAKELPASNKHTDSSV